MAEVDVAPRGDHVEPDRERGDGHDRPAERPTRPAEPLPDERHPLVALSPQFSHHAWESSHALWQPQPGWRAFRASTTMSVTFTAAATSANTPNTTLPVTNSTTPTPNRNTASALRSSRIARSRSTARAYGGRVRRRRGRAPAWPARRDGRVRPRTRPAGPPRGGGSRRPRWPRSARTRRSHPHAR